MQHVIENTTAHIKRIDVLRGVAILIVFLYHSQIEIFPGYEIKTHKGFLLDTENKPLYKIILNFIPTAFGATGVQLFLIISGFLIHYGYLIREKKMNAAHFYSRRFFRIYPPYLLAVIFFAFATSGLNYLTTKQGLVDLLSHLFLVHNLSDNTFFGINPAFWSLALEMQLYLIYPLFLAIRSKIGINTATFSVLFIGIITTLFIGYVDKVSFSASVLRYWIVWIGGAYLAESYFYNKQIFAKHSLFLLILIPIILLLKFTVLYRFFGAYLISLGYIILIEYYLNKKATEAKPIEKLLIQIGLCSYSLYLIHQPFLGKMLQTFSFLGLSEKHYLFYSINTVIVFLVLYLISYSLYLLIELPSIALSKNLPVKKKVFR